MRVALVINKTDRELPIMEKIKGWLLRLAPRTEVIIVDFHDPQFHIRIIEFAPDTVLTFPFTVAGLSARFYLLKYLQDCFIVCFRTEGAIDFTSDKQLKWLAGMDRYGPELVDYELFWGRKTAEMVATTLMEQGKLSSFERVSYFGYPNFESYLGEGAAEAGELPAELAQRLAATEPGKTLFFITGFHLADYTPEDLVNAGDILRRDDPAFETQYREALDGVERAKRFRQLWIERIIQAADENPAALFIVKCHPIETEIHFRQQYHNPYLRFAGHRNIVYVTENVPVGAILPHCSLFFQYGSTCLAESYLLQVPSVFVTSAQIYRQGTPSVYDYSDLGWPATLQADILEVPELVRRHLQEPVCFEINRSETERVLKDVFNVDRANLDGTTPYLPSRDIALFLLDLGKESPQRLDPKDPYLLEATRIFGDGALSALGQDGSTAEARGETLRALGIFNQMARLAALARRREPDLEYLRALCLSRLDCHGAAAAIAKELLLQAPDHGRAAELLQQLLAHPASPAAGSQLAMMRYDGNPQRIPGYLQEADAAGAPALAESLSRALLVQEESPQALARLALAEAGRGEAGEALRLFSRALALDPDTARTGSDLIALLAGRGREKEADALRSRLYLMLEHDPSFLEELRQSGHAARLASLSREFQLLQPRVFMIETSLACDLRCPECAIGGKLIDRRPGFMDLRRFRRIVDKVRPFAEYIYLHIWGEPMLNPEIIPMIRYASAHARTNISTNGMSMTEALAEAVITSGVSDLLVSIDGVSQESYGAYRVGGEVEKAFAALEMLQRANVRHGSKVAIMPQFIVFRHNQHEREPFRERCRALGLEPTFKAPYLRSDSRFEPGDDPAYQRPRYPDLEMLRQAMSGCPDPREVCTILNDGSVVACCYDHNGQTSFGSIFDHDLLELWNSHRFRQFRWDIVSGNAPSFCVENCMSYFLAQGEAAQPAAAKDPVQVAFTSPATEPACGIGTGGEGGGRKGGRRRRSRPAGDPGELLALARKMFADGSYNDAFDLYEQVTESVPGQTVPVLAEVFDRYQSLPDQETRYHLYVSRFFDFAIEPGDKVLDIGSGHLPFPFATHLADLALSDGRVGRAGVPFRHLDGKPVYECGVEKMPFTDKEFDFVYCSHVLEHATDPEEACRELMRVARRGYIETPTRGKDLWLDTAKISNHRWAVEWSHDTLVFTEYTPEEVDGLRSDILLNMHCAPQTEREKAFSALIYLKAHLVNTMVYWEDSFKFEVRRLGAVACAAAPARRGPAPAAAAKGEEKPLCLFLNTYYGAFLQDFYARHPDLPAASYREQQQALEGECFGDSNFYSDGMIQAEWRAADLIINCLPLQQAWAREHGFDGEGIPLVLEQIRRLAPDVVYIQDMHVMGAEFLAALRPLVRLVVGQIASPFGPHIPLEQYDIVFTSFPHYVERFRQQGATAYYQPLAFDPRVLQALPPLPHAARPVDCSFVGGISALHTGGTALLETLVHLTPIRLWGYGAGTLPEDSPLRQRHCGETWGKEMFGILASSRITVNRHVDVAERFANNMRLFEAAGCGALLITDYKENLNDLFEIGKEVVAYRSAEECAALINYYLAHPDEAEAIARAGQKRTLGDHCYSRRLGQSAEILQRHLRYQDEQQRLPDLDLAKISFGHAAIDRTEVTETMTSAWQDSELPARQRALVQQELAQMYRGNVAPAFQVLAHILRHHTRPGAAILEIGCASGYYYEILEYLLQRRIDYTGVDYSPTMIAMAKQYYPKTQFYAADGASLCFSDRQFHTVISSCVLLHVPNYREHIFEAARVAESVVVASRTPVCKRRPTQYLKKYAYGVETVELIFNEEELLREFALNRFHLAQAIEYQAEPSADLYQTTYLFKRDGETKCSGTA